MTEPKSVVEYGQKCLLCREDAATSRVLCWRHIDEMRDMLDVENEGSTEHDIPPGIPHLYNTLDIMPGSTGPDGGRRAPGFESMPPLNLHVVALRDPRTLPSDDDPVRSIPGTITAIAESVAADINERPGMGAYARGVDGMCGWLSSRLEAVTRLPWADDLYRDLRHLRDALRAAHGEPLPRPVGHCTNTITAAGLDGPGSHSNAPCGGPLYAPPAPTRATTIRCGRCGHVYDGLDQLRLSLESPP
jgi:hypothetical protein